MVAEGKVSLAAGPDGNAPVGAPLGSGRVGFDVPLVHWTSTELPFDDDVGLGEPCLGIAQPELEPVGHVAGFRIVVPPTALPQVGVGQRHQAIMQDRSVVLHSLVGVEHWWQYIVVHIQGRQGLLSSSGGGRRHRRHGVSDIEGLLSRHDVAAVETVVNRCSFLLVGDFRRDLRQVLGSHNGLDARDGQGPGGVDAADDGVGVGASKYLAHQPAGWMDIGGVPGPAGDLVRPVVADGSRADDVERLIHGCRNSLLGCHNHSWTPFKLFT